MDCSEHSRKGLQFILLAALALVACAAAILIAVVMNGSFWLSLGAPIPMAIAAGIAGGASLLVRQASNELQRYIDCGGVHATCAGDVYNLRNALDAAIILMRVLASSAIAVLPGSWAWLVVRR